MKKGEQIMKRLISTAIATLVAVCFVGPLSVASADSTGSEKQKQEYVSTAKAKPLLTDELQAFPGMEVQVVEYELAPGWVGGRHYHTGDVFVYVQEGEFVVDLDGEGRKTFGPGQVYHEAVNVKMTARNGKTDKPTKILLFQVGNKAEPLMIKAD